jgi:hypothetical protein
MVGLIATATITIEIRRHLLLSGAIAVVPISATTNVLGVMRSGTTRVEGASDDTVNPEDGPAGR